MTDTINVVPPFEIREYDDGIDLCVEVGGFLHLRWEDTEWYNGDDDLNIDMYVWEEPPNEWAWQVMSGAERGPREKIAEGAAATEDAAMIALATWVRQELLRTEKRVRQVSPF